MKYLIAALLITVSTPALADNIAGCEVVLMERIAQEGLEGSAEVASFRPAADFIASIYDDETEIMREIDGLPIRAIMCKRKSVVPSLRDFPIVATGTPFMISQNFESTESGLTTIYFKDGEFRSSYKGPDLDEDTAEEMADRLEVFNLQPHDLAEKEQAMLKKTGADDSDEEIKEAESEEIHTKGDASKENVETSTDIPEEEQTSEGEETPSTDEAEETDDFLAESAEEDNASNGDEETDEDTGSETTESEAIKETSE